MLDAAVLLLSGIALDSGVFAFVAIFLLVLAISAPLVHLR